MARILPTTRIGATIPEPRRALAALALASILLVGRAAVAQGRTSLDGVAAFVGGAHAGPGVLVILASDVELRARVRLAGLVEIPSPGTIAIPDEVRRAAFDELVGECLIAREAARIELTTPSELQIDAEWRRLFAAVGGAERLDGIRRALGASEAEIETMVRRRALVAAFLAANLDAALVTDAEVEAAYYAGNHPFVGDDLQTAREVLRIYLSRRRIEDSVARWIEVLEQRTVIRIAPPFARLGSRFARHGRPSPAASAGGSERGALPSPGERTGP